MQAVSENKFMPKQPLTTAVLFLIFNRLDTTKRVFESIRQAKPPRLYVAADGPRDSRPGEDVKIMTVRDHVMRHIDWDCEVKTLFREKNLGCKFAVSSAIDWFFANEEMGIILEDDCLPVTSFFPFCQELLEKYRYDRRVMMISGTNTLGEWKSNIESYHFSFFGMIWGWASWRRAWDYYDVEMKLWAESEMKIRVRDVLGDENKYQRVKKVFDSIYSGLDTWDYQFTFSRLSQSGLAIIPSVNLISNIGFGQEATHTKTLPEGISNLSLNLIKFPLKHPYGVGVDGEYTEKHNKKFMPRSLPHRAVKKLKQMLRRCQFFS